MSENTEMKNSDPVPIPKMPYKKPKVEQEYTETAEDWQQFVLDKLPLNDKQKHELLLKLGYTVMTKEDEAKAGIF